MSKFFLEKLNPNEIVELAEFFDMLAMYDHEDKLVSEPRSSLPLEDLGPDSNKGSGAK